MKAIPFTSITAVILLCMVLIGCAPRGEKAVPWPFDENEYVFIEYRQEEDGRVIRGEFPPGPMIDFPTYMFDPHNGTLVSHEITFAVDDTLKIVLGKSTALRGAAGGGMTSRLIGIYRLPYQNRDILLRGVDEYGNAHIQFQNEELVIESGDEWGHVTTRRDTIGTPGERSIAEFTKTIRLINYGILDKSNIRKW